MLMACRNRVSIAQKPENPSVTSGDWTHERGDEFIVRKRYDFIMNPRIAILDLFCFSSSNGLLGTGNGTAQRR